jgi:hypothetical protein
MRKIHSIKEAYLQTKYAIKLRWGLHKHDVFAWLEKYAQPAIYAVSLIGVLVVASIIIGENRKIARDSLQDAHTAGFKMGYDLAVSEATDKATKAATDKACMAFWFSGDTAKVGKAIEKVKMK